MTDDPIITELHKHRRERAAKFNYDLHAMVDDLCAFQNDRPETILPAPPKPTRRKTRTRSPQPAKDAE